jgi:hypothetical protein
MVLGFKASFLFRLKQPGFIKYVSMRNRQILPWTRARAVPKGKLWHQEILKNVYYQGIILR